MKRWLIALVLLGCTEPREERPPPLQRSPEADAIGRAAGEAAKARREREERADAAPALVLLGRYTTNYAYQGPHENRAKNIERIASLFQRFDVLRELGPGDEWSFNVSVGPRSIENGFLPAPAIFMGEVADDIGGGTCQASSTTFAAAIAAGLDITMRTSHSRPSKYIPKGLDATVSYPADCDGGDCAKLDLRFKNPYAFPITMKVEVGEPYPDDAIDGALRGLKPITVSFLGAGPAAKVEHRWLGGHEDASWEKRFHKTGRIRTATYRKKIQEGAAGAAGVLQVTRVFPDGRLDMQRFTSNYRPVDETWEVGLEWDMSRKPWDPQEPMP